MNDYPVGGDFFQATAVYGADDVELATGFDIAVVRAGTRPFESADWVAPIVIASKSGFMTGGRSTGFWQVWARLTGVAPETPTIYLGTFRLY